MQINIHGFALTRTINITQVQNIGKQSIRVFKDEGALSNDKVN